MNENIFTMSKNGVSEYCCTVVRIGEVLPIEGSDFLGQTLIFGESIVVRKDSIKEGDFVFYATNETQLNKKFLSVNNLFEIGERSLNSNYETVEKLMQENRVDEAKSLVGFFNKHGRVKMIRLRGIVSMGFVFKKEELVRYNPKVADVDLESIVGVDFDTIDGELFVKAYVKPLPEERSKSNANRADKKIKKFNRMIPGQFSFHYDTNPLQKNIHRIKPTDIVTISLKEHGTSAIFANILTKKPINLSLIDKIFNKKYRNEIKNVINKSKNSYVLKQNKENKISELRKHIKPNFVVGYGNVYASRKIIKNQTINQNVGKGYYKSDVWGYYNKLIEKYISKGMTLYGEILGYVPETNTPIQGSYDYGCKPGESYLMPYRITTVENGKKKEWNVEDVYKWTVKLLKDVPSLKQNVKPIKILYHGTLKDLYPEISTTEHWHDNVLQAMKKDKEHFAMEENEPFCKNKVPREGLCIRIDNDEIAECFKLKCQRFIDKESKEIDKGNVDIEMEQAYCNNEEN